MTLITQQIIDQIVNSNIPERLSLDERPPIPDDHVAHVFQLTEMGQTALAADHLLFPEISGILSKTISGVIRRLNILFALSQPSRGSSKESFEEKVSLRQWAYEMLLEIALNFYGLESRWLQEEEKYKSLQYILTVLDEWEKIERKEEEGSIASAVVQKWLSRMKKVQKGNSMVAKTASRIESSLNFQKPILVDFLKKAKEEIEGNIYYQLVKDGKCRFGNDYALGLRWLRHLGFEQVSTNPVLAARAYQDDPDLVEIFREELRHHPSFRKWSSRSSQYGDEITLFSTLLALWDNLYVFRPIFFNLRDTSGGGVVSFQLNPNIAHLEEESIRDVFKAFSIASENLLIYDQYLLAGYRLDGEKGRPNMVIKVAATTPVAKTITRTINSFGFGSNITVDFSVSQEATLILEEMDGMARAIKKGIRPTQLYMTNMGGRLESHLREVKLEDFFVALKKKVGQARAMEKVTQLSEVNGTKEKVLKGKTYEEKVWAATRYAHGQRKLDGPIFEALKDIVSQEALEEWENAIAKSGTLVARKVWGLFFSEANRERWMSYLMRKHGLTRDQAGLIMGQICYLPASKRKPFDTYWTLSCRNLVHTEFPDHQENVKQMPENCDFDIKDYEESISKTFPSDVVKQLNEIEDFVKAYEMNHELSKLFREVGIPGDFGLRGLEPSEWAEFGPVQKTLAEFKGAYDTFQKEMVSIVQKLGRKKGQTKERQRPKKGAKRSG